MTEKDFVLPAGVGPHEEKELELMLAGQKPLAMLHDDWPVDWEHPKTAFQPYVKSGKIVAKEHTYIFSDGDTLHYYYFALPDEAWRIDEMIAIHTKLFDENQPTTDEIERRIGELLGYTAKEIEAYLSWIKKT